MSLQQENAGQRDALAVRSVLVASAGSCDQLTSDLADRGLVLAAAEADLENERASAVHTLDEARLSSAQAEAAEGGLSVLQDELAGLSRDEEGKVQQKCGDDIEETVSLRQQLAVVGRERDSAADELTLSISRRVELEMEATKSREMVAKQQKSISALRKSVAELENTNADLLTQLSGLNDVVLKDKETITVLKGNIKSEKLLTMELTGITGQLQRELAELEDASGAREQTKNAELQALESRLSATQAKISAQQLQLTTAEVKNTNCQNSMQETIDVLRAERDDLAADIQLRVTLKAQQEELIKELRATMSDQDATVKDLHCQITQHETDIAALQTEVDEHQFSLYSQEEQSSDALEKMGRELTEYKEKGEILAAENALVSAELVGAKTQLAVQERLLVETKLARVTSQAVVSEQEQKIEQMEGANRILESDITTLNEQHVHTLMQCESEYDSQRQQWEGEMEELRIQRADWQRRLAELEARHSDMGTECTNLRIQNAECVEEYSALSEQLQQARANLLACVAQLAPAIKEAHAIARSNISMGYALSSLPPGSSNSHSRTSSPVPRRRTHSPFGIDSPNPNPNPALSPLRSTGTGTGSVASFGSNCDDYINAINELSSTFGDDNNDLGGNGTSRSIAELFDQFSQDIAKVTTVYGHLMTYSRSTVSPLLVLHGQVCKHYDTKPSNSEDIETLGRIQTEGAVGGKIYEHMCAMKRTIDQLCSITSRRPEIRLPSAAAPNTPGTVGPASERVDHVEALIRNQNIERKELLEQLAALEKEKKYMQAQISAKAGKLVSLFHFYSSVCPLIRFV